MGETIDQTWETTYRRVRPDIVSIFERDSGRDELMSALMESADAMTRAEAAGVYAAILDVWFDGDRQRLRWARRASDALAQAVKRERRLDPADFIERAKRMFQHTGYLKDYKALWRLARRVDRLDVLDEVGDVIRRELPDVWIQNALKRGDVDAAIDCWFEREDHPRIRQCADELVAATPGRVDILVSGRLSVVNYRIGRGSRRHYRKACKLLSALRRELEKLGEVAYWPLVIEDVTTQHDHRPALLDEMAKAGFIDPPS